MAHCIGNLLMHTRAFVVDRAALSGLAQVLATLAPEDREVLSHVVADGWYDEHLLFRLLRAIDSLIGRGDLALLRELGRENADRDMNGPQRFFFRLANPAYVLEKASSYWNRFHDTGHWEVKRQPNGAVGTLLDFDVDDERFCATVNGYIERMFELVGAREPRSDHTQCRGRADASCVFVVSWR
jgi:hypothetical protein